jgi:phosphomevalonate kinase
MKIIARAPGKLAILGEYAVLDGVEALVMAVDRHCRADIATRDSEPSTVTVQMPDSTRHALRADGTTGVAVVDLVARHFGALTSPPAFEAHLDSRPFFRGAQKLGLGSSAASLCAWAGAREAFERCRDERSRLGLNQLIALHRALQGGAGSGLDVAASLTGGVVSFRLSADSSARVGSVRLPNGVAFAGIFAGASASTPDFVGSYRAWQGGRPRESRNWLREAKDIAMAGSSAVREGDADGLLAAVQQYGRALESLGNRLGRDIVTAEHRELGERAARFGLAYKVSGAGGGDLGLVFGIDAAAMSRFRDEVHTRGFDWIELNVEEQGLTIEEHSA